MHDLIPSSPAQKVLDSSKLSTYEECRRKFFYAHVLGWRPDRPNIHLEAGVAVHLACEHLLLAHKAKGEITSEDIATAFKLFESHYRDFFPPETDPSNAPKDPANILTMLVQLGSQYLPKKLEQAEVLYTEVGGTIHVGEYLVAFKIDALLRGEGGIEVNDFKTASMDSEAGRAQYSLSTQIGTYLHVAESVFGESERVKGANIIQLVLRKSGNAINDIPIVRTPEHMLNWLFTTNYYIKELEWNYEHLAETKEGDTVLEAFPMNPTACTKYGVCPYHRFCTAWGNPLQRCGEPPVGFRVEHWNPLDVQRTARNVLQDGKLVENPEADAERSKAKEGKLDAVNEARVEATELYKGLF